TGAFLPIPLIDGDALLPLPSVEGASGLAQVGFVRHANCGCLGHDYHRRIDHLVGLSRDSRFEPISLARRKRVHALLKIPRLTALRCAPVRRRPGLRIAEAAAERPREEVAAVVLITALIVATLVVAWRHRGGATTRAFATVDRTFNDLAVLAVQN